MQAADAKCDGFIIYVQADGLAGKAHDESQEANANVMRQLAQLELKRRVLTRTAAAPASTMSPHLGYSLTVMCMRVITNARFASRMAAGMLCARPRTPGPRNASRVGSNLTLPCWRWRRCRTSYW